MSREAQRMEIVIAGPRLSRHTPRLLMMSAEADQMEISSVLTKCSFSPPVDHQAMEEFEGSAEKIDVQIDLKKVRTQKALSISEN